MVAESPARALGAEMDRIAAHFSLLGYKGASAKVYISRLAKFSDFAGRNGRTATINQDVIPRIAARTAHAPGRTRAVFTP